MADLIDRDKVIDVIARYYGTDQKNIIDDIKKIPSGILYCRDCRYFSEEAIGEYHLCHKGGYFKENGYCSRAERRGNE